MTTMTSTFRQPSVFVPVVMSCIALALVLGSVAIFGAVHQADEGVLAHIWQLLIAVQFPIIAFFAIKYLPQRPRQTLLILGLQLAAVLVACAPVFLLRL